MSNRIAAAFLAVPRDAYVRLPDGSQLVCGDGRRGHEAGAPYNRIVAGHQPGRDYQWHGSGKSSTAA